MAKKAKILGPLAVKRISRRGFNTIGEVPGLGLQVAKGGSRNWVLRVMIAGKQRDMGLGGYPGVTLEGVKRLARDAREEISKGNDPIAQRREAKSALRVAEAAALTFEQCAKHYIAAKESEWSNPKHGQQWRNTLETYAYPTMGKVLVRDITLPLVLGVLKPIWNDKTETATRLKGRIESILDWATVSKYRSGDNPARWKGNLDVLLAKPDKIARTVHHAALPFDEVGAFMARLRNADGIGARALELAILTATRSGEVRGATWNEIDMQGKEWRIPAERMKAKREHRVPLSDSAIAVLKGLTRGEPDALVFPAPKGGMLSDMTLTAILRRMKVDAVPHGFRSSFRDWCSERTSYPHELAEMALAHTIGNKVEAAYRRGDLFDKRRRLMNDWAKFCNTVATDAKVIPMSRTSSTVRVSASQ